MTPHKVCRALQQRLNLFFEDDPSVEVGKVRRSSLVQDGFFFHVIVLGHDGDANGARRTTVHCSPGRTVVEGPDEQSIGAVLRSGALV
jgi:hypothetical protein